MSKVIKIVFILFVLVFFISFNNIYALNMDIPETTPTEDINQDNSTNNPNAEVEPDNTNAENLTNIDNTMEVMDEALTPTITTNPSSLPESNLGLTNVINILLIVVGFILILLGIAIILRLRH